MRRGLMGLWQRCLVRLLRLSWLSWLSWVFLVGVVDGWRRGRMAPRQVHAVVGYEALVKKARVPLQGCQGVVGPRSPGCPSSVRRGEGGGEINIGWAAQGQAERG